MIGTRTWTVARKVNRAPPVSSAGSSTASPARFTGASTIEPTTDPVAVPPVTGPHVSSRRIHRSPLCNWVTMPGSLSLRITCSVTTSTTSSSPDAPPTRIDSSVATSTPELASLARQ
ncbi:hypothetical protein MOKP45_24000 [Mycobacterium avium subsp. hominissuis]